MIVQHRQRDVGQQRSEDPALRSAGLATAPRSPFWVMTPAFRNAFTNASRCLSEILPEAGPSTRCGRSRRNTPGCRPPRPAHSHEEAMVLDLGEASCARRFGRNPYEHGLKSASKIGSNTCFTAACTTRSARVGIPSLRTFPMPFGIFTRRTATGGKVRDFSPSRSRPGIPPQPHPDDRRPPSPHRHRGLPPWFPETRSHASIRNAGS